MALTAEQLAMRQNGIGASEVAAILDLYPPTWKQRSTPESVFREKVGLAPPFEGNDRTRIGDRLEPYVAQWWAEDHGREVYKNSVTRVHPSIPWLFATVDYRIKPDDGILECKVVSHWVGKYWGEEPPSWVYYQCLIQMAVEGRQEAHVAAHIQSGNQLVTPYVIEFDQGAFDDALVTLDRFWGRVLAARAEQERKAS